MSLPDTSALARTRRYWQRHGHAALSRRLLHELRVRLQYPLYNVGYRVLGRLDGSPIPPPHLVSLVIGTRELAWYRLGGMFNHQAITECLYANGIAAHQLTSILDFGCGCGRILRWWGSLRGSCEIWGTDYNPELIRWCKRNLADMARFAVNKATPPLPSDDAKFQLVYSYSVFTHLASDSQRPWFEELERILVDGGVALITVLGERSLRRHPELAPVGTLRDRGLLVFEEGVSGSNECTAYHSEAFVRSVAAECGLEVIDYLPAGVRDPTEQDVYLLRKGGPRRSD